MKRTPLTRRTPLKARTALRTKTRLRPYSTKRRKRDANYAAARVEVFERAQGRCEAPQHADGCSGQVEQVHHLAGRGGSDPHRLENLAGLSAVCHSAAHLYPAWAYETGLSIRKNRGGAA